jgi:hypothetical protein
MPHMGATWIEEQEEAEEAEEEEEKEEAKLSLCLVSKARRRKDGKGNGRISTFLTRHCMEASGQLRAPAALPPEKKTPVPIE